MKPSFLFLACLWALTSSLMADLEWTCTEVAKQVPKGTETVIAEYPFKNSGDTTITVKSLSASCGCTTPELEKRVYAPGETGVVRLVFQIGSRVGAQSKRVIVETEPDRKFVLLKLNATIGE